MNPNPLEIKVFKPSERGVSLIEIALALLVISLIMTPLLMVYNAEYKRAQINKTLGTFYQLEDALNRYINENDRYPQPARLTLAEGDADFGLQIDASAGIDSCPNMNNGVCRFVNTATGTSLLIGGVPFASLNIESAASLDSWQNKIVYVITEAQATPGVFNPAGSQEIILQYYNAVTDALEPARIFVGTTEQDHVSDALFISMGNNGRGAFNAEGLRAEVCSPTNTVPMENINCGFNTDNFILYLTAAGVNSRNLAEGNIWFMDDLTHYVNGPRTSEWNENVNSSQYVVTDRVRVGIGVDDPLTTLDVAGTVNVREQLLTEQICRNGNCFDPEKIYGQDPDMVCNNVNSINSVAPSTGIGMLNGQTSVVCGSPVDSAGNPILGQRSDSATFVGSFAMPAAGFTPGGCPADKRVIAIDASGVITCEP